MGRRDMLREWIDLDQSERLVLAMLVDAMRFGEWSEATARAVFRFYVAASGRCPHRYVLCMRGRLRTREHRCFRTLSEMAPVKRSGDPSNHLISCTVVNSQAKQFLAPGAPAAARGRKSLTCRSQLTVDGSACL